VEDPLHGASIDEKLERIAEMLRAIADEEPAMRRRLRALRASPEYREAFETPDPLVSIVIPTYRSFEQLRDVALPSALAQTHRNIEVLVVGDAAPPETAEVVAGFGDDRVRFDNLPVRGPYPEDSDRAWLVTGSPPYNAGVAAARGLWIAALADDDAFTPDHVELLLAAAVERGLEFAYSPLRAHLSDGSEVLVGEFPPRLGEFGLQGAIYHAGLTFMDLHLADEVFDVPNDWSLCRRMLRAGVRMGMIEQPTVDYYPSYEWGRRPRPMQRREARAAQVDAAEQELADAHARIADLERELAVIASSHSWRLTRPLRAVGRQVRDRRAAGS
jgi:glycosyltransferase involved in cell wall biosynthesis